MTKHLMGIVLLLLALPASSEPWINTEDLFLRSDIETLSDIGVIKVPITTYPLMWSGVIKDLEQTDITKVPFEYKQAYWRVKKAGKLAFAKRAKRMLSVSVANSEQLIRGFGDSLRGKGELRANYSKVGKYLAWKLQVSRVRQPLDRDSTRYDGSYLAVVWDNWVASVGEIEKWWGPAWDSTNLLSNNARVPLGISLTRNYSNRSHKPLFNWSATAFVSRLDDDRDIKDPVFSGGSLSIKPLDSLETSFRITSLSGGKSDVFIPDFKSKKMIAIDVRWRLPSIISRNIAPTNLYLAITDQEQQSGYATKQLGLSSRLRLLNADWRVYLEATDTRGARDKGVRPLNITFEDDVYRSGYRYERRAIGSTYDGDSQAITLGLLGNITRYQSLSLKLQNLKINQNITINPIDALHTLSSKLVRAKRIVVKWEYIANRNNRFDVEVDYTDKAFETVDYQREKTRFTIGWSYLL